MTLADWLATRAQLSGRQLASAIKLCDEAMADTVAHLRDLSIDKENFKDAFPAAVIRSAISRALENYGGIEQQSREEDPPHTVPSSLRKLPEGKR